MLDKNVVQTIHKQPSDVFYEKGVSINFAKETLAQVFPYEFCKIPKNTLFTEHLWTTASDNSYFRRDSIFSQNESENERENKSSSGKGIK